MFVLIYNYFILSRLLARNLSNHSKSLYIILLDLADFCAIAHSYLITTFFPFTIYTPFAGVLTR